MKLLLLNVLAAAIACSSLNFTAKNKAADNNRTPLAHGIRYRYEPGTDVGGPTGNPVYNEDESDVCGNDNCFCPNEIGRSGKIVGTLYSYGSGSRIETDEDWFLFTTPRRATYTFSIEAPDNYYAFDVFRYHHDGYDERHTETEMICNANHSRRTVSRELLPGSYYIHVFSEYQRQLDGNAKYQLTYTYLNAPIVDIEKFSDVTEPFGDGKEVIVWQNDLVPSNIDRWGASKQLIRDGTYDRWWNISGFLDPIFMEDTFDYPGFAPTKDVFLDSWIFIFDKSVLHEIADNCRILADYVNNLEIEEVKQVKARRIKEVWEFAASAAMFVVDLVATAASGPVGATLTGASLVFSSCCLAESFCNLLEFNDSSFGISRTALGWNLCTLRRNCLYALEHDNYGIRLPRFYKLTDGGPWDDLKTYWVTSSFEPRLVPGATFEEADNYYLVDKNSDFSSHVFYNDYEDNSHEYYGTISYYKDMEEFSSLTNFSFGHDIIEEQGGQLPEGQQQPVRALKSISLSGNYPKSFFAGDSFNTNGMFVTARYSDGTTEVMDYGCVDYCSYDYRFENNSESHNRGVDNVTDVDMYNEGEYWVVVFFRAPVINVEGTNVGTITKYAKYRISVSFERETHYSYAVLDLYGRDFTYLNGHGETCYYLDTEIQIPIANAGPSIWSSVEYIDFEAVGNLDIYDVRVFPNGETGYFNVIVKSHNGTGQSSLYIDFSYKTVIPLPVLESISVSGGANEFFLGEELTYDGLIVTAHYTSGDLEEVYDYEIDSSDYNPFVVGTYNILITYSLYGVTKTSSYQVVVRKPQLISIYLMGDYPTVFDAGDNFTYEGLEVLARYENNSSFFVSNFFVDDSGVDMNCPGTHEVVVYYTEDGITQSANYSICVNELPSLESITVSGNYQTVFQVGDVFNYDDLIVTAHYSDGTSRIVSDYTVNTRFLDMNIAGTYTIRISYTENDVTKGTTYSIQVVYNGPTLTGITLSGNYKTEFELGESFSYSGLVVTAHYSDGTSRQVTDYSVMAISYNSFKPGTYRVYVNYDDNGGTAMAIYTVTVQRLFVFSLLDSITLSGKHPTAFIRGEEFTYDGLIVTAHYADGSQATVTDYTVDSSAVNMKKSGTYPVVVTYTEGRTTVSAIYNVTVIKALPHFPIGK